MVNNLLFNCKRKFEIINGYHETVICKWKDELENG